MLTIQLLGGASIKGEDGPLAGPATQRHRLALLALLATVRPGGIARDKLLAFLWPERDADHGRNLLNQTIHVLRKALGEEALLSAGEEIRLDLRAVRVDVVEFEETLEAGDLGRAAELYRGPFLDGFFLPDALEFERWVDSERARLREGYRNALEGLARAAEAEGDRRGAAEWWRRLAGEDPYSSRVTLELMRALEAAGDRADAIRHARVHALLLEQEFGAEPDPAVAALAERMRTDPEAEREVVDRMDAEAERPARDEPLVESVAAALGVDAKAEGTRRPEPARTSVREVTGRPGVRGAVVLLGAIALLAAGAYSWGGLGDRTGGGAPPASTSPVAPTSTVDESPAPSVAVLAFDDMSPGADQAWFADGVAEEILSTLAGVEGLRVSARQSSFAFRGTPVDVRRIGDSLGVASVLEGSVRKGGDSVWVTAQLIDAATGFHRWSETYAKVPTAENLRAIQLDIAREVARALELQWRPAPELERAAPDEAEYQAYLQGRYHLRRVQTAFEEDEAFHREEVLRSIELFREIVARSPAWAPGWAALGEALHWAASGGIESGTYYPESKAALERALELDPELGQAHSSLGFVLLNWELDFDGAEARYRHALDLGEEGAWSGYARLLYATGRYDEAVGALRRAAAHDPLRIPIKILLGRAYLCAGRFDEAVEHGERAFALERGAWGLWTLAQALERSGRVEEALARIDEEERKFDGGPGWHVARALLHARAGRADEARALLRRWEEEAGKAAPPAYRIHAATLAALGDTDAAIEAIEWVAVTFPFSVLGGHCYPELRVLEQGPRIQELVRGAVSPDR